MRFVCCGSEVLHLELYPNTKWPRPRCGVRALQWSFLTVDRNAAVEVCLRCQQKEGAR